MPNVSIKLYHRCVCIGKSRVSVGFSTVLGFRHLLGVLECIPPDKGDHCNPFTLWFNWRHKTCKQQKLKPEIFWYLRMSLTFEHEWPKRSSGQASRPGQCYRTSTRREWGTIWRGAPPSLGWRVFEGRVDLMLVYCCRAWTASAWVATEQQP